MWGWAIVVGLFGHGVEAVWIREVGGRGSRRDVYEWKYQVIRVGCLQKMGWGHKVMWDRCEWS